MLPQWHIKDPDHATKTAGGRLQINTHVPSVRGFPSSDIVHACTVYTEHTKMAAVSCSTSHASAVSATLWWMFKNALQKAIHSCGIPCSKQCESAQERRIALYKTNQSTATRPHPDLLTNIPPPTPFPKQTLRPPRIMTSCSRKMTW